MTALATTSTIQTHIDAFLLAVASSTDNFMVGITAGLSSTSMSHFYRINFAVAVCNSAGTLLATYGGDNVKQLPEFLLLKLASAVSSSSSPETYRLNFSIESVLAGAAFGYLAVKEWFSSEEDDPNDDDEDEKNTKKRGQQQNNGNLTYSIALPMTLNNLAGGVAGGVLGLSVFQATFYAFLVSLGSMAAGFHLASNVVTLQQQSRQNNNNNNTQRSDQNNNSTMLWCKYVAVFIYLALSIQSFMGL